MTYNTVLKDWHDIEYYFNRVYDKEFGVITHQSFMILESSIFNLIKEIQMLTGWERVKAHVIKHKAQSMYLKAKNSKKW